MDQRNYRLRPPPYYFRFGGPFFFQLLRLFLPQSVKERSPLPPSVGFFAAIAATTLVSTSGPQSSGSISPGSRGRIDLLNVKVSAPRFI